MNRKPARTYISPQLYKKILDSVPIPCVDMVIVHGKKFLLGKRANRPAKGKWWFVGGRIHKGERFTQAVRRKMKEETGLPVRSVSFLDTAETIFRNSHFRGVASHTINSIFVTHVSSERLRNDSQHAELRWFTEVNPRWDAYVKNALIKAGFPLSRRRA